jgi:hypothetical protein
MRCVADLDAISDFFVGFPKIWTEAEQGHRTVWLRLEDSFGFEPDSHRTTN